MTTSPTDAHMYEGMPVHGLCACRAHQTQTRRESLIRGDLLTYLLTYLSYTETGRPGGARTGVVRAPSRALACGGGAGGGTERRAEAVAASFPSRPREFELNFLFIHLYARHRARLTSLISDH